MLMITKEAKGRRSGTKNKMRLQKELNPNGQLAQS
jgi:hypothetical protein